MDPQLFWELSLLGVLLVITRVLYLVFQITTGNTRCSNIFGRSNCKTMIFIGSGGHTTEMLKLLKGVDFSKFKPRFYVMANTDQRSYDKVVNFEKEKGDSKDFSIIRVPRSREVHQSYLTSIVTTLYSILYSVPVVLKTRPDIVICNGPGSCVPICFVCFLLKCLFIKNIQIVFVESYCRVKTFSLTGKIMAYMADNFLVHWLELRHKMRRTEYIGRLM
ncbi:UDP-N-acetylglucosamine transferase subunit ALG14 homolog [Coccinella septempunctata]|uniref:UDP-N-acetylglucosamine transferase subunit ALG14 homolog n=1 Tax=Coccinella septempunctata TaxID=41139 RepID=UPI001D095BF2|nr:UDP-N-acetylglucosamine transferase subunit ALG14 homolog [Coccinella septempunctata]